VAREIRGGFGAQLGTDRTHVLAGAYAIRPHSKTKKIPRRR